MSVSADNLNVFLELARRNDAGGGHVNRIPLHVTEITFSANKTIPNIGVPFSGAIRGEATNLAFDMGIVQKTVSIQGVLLDQIIQKDNNTSPTTHDVSTGVKLTAFELAQLIHSYVDSSSFQDDQNLNKLLVFYPSRVDNNFNYRTGVDENTEIDSANIAHIPWSWKNRAYDNQFTAMSGNTTDSPSTIFDNISKTSEHIGLSGFIRSFSATFSGAEFPAVSFSLEFEESTVISDNFFD